MRVSRISVAYDEHGRVDVQVTVPAGELAHEEVTLVVDAEGQRSLNTVVWELREEVERLARLELKGSTASLTPLAASEDAPATPSGPSRPE